MQRREFLNRGLQLGMALALGGASSSSLATISREQRLKLYNIHTGEHLDACLFANGKLRNDQLSDLNYLMRDYRNNEQIEIDVALYRQMLKLQQHFGGKPLEIISGYRSPATNELLRRQSDGVAKKSLHMEGKAVDIHIAGVSTRDLQKAALAMGQGGVGYYPKSGFVHIDTGRVRSW